jgi:hypothetical protein
MPLLVKVVIPKFCNKMMRLRECSIAGYLIKILRYKRTLSAYEKTNFKKKDPYQGYLYSNF